MVTQKLQKRLAASVLKCGEPCWIPPDERLLKLQKRLAASVLKCGSGKIWLDPNEADEITMATLDSGPAAAVAPAPQASGVMISETNVQKNCEHFLMRNMKIVCDELVARYNCKCCKATNVEQAHLVPAGDFYYLGILSGFVSF
ncbi:hypothetical protein RHSIM_Rhsim04G0227600 [Rhododendron simsii]|uniref:Ribosomal protein L19 n=1 Tax=Rhododendron simsii TaxID=118357 RepID=A0A834LQG9_RHOSS|nr:hypothetical protein RHSIM_Rhsim04G0227600 [Rhododendron simsii]